MNYPLIFKLLSAIFVTLLFAFIACILVGFFHDPFMEDYFINGWVLSLAITTALAIACYVLGRNASNKMFRQEALFLIGVAWLSCSVVGALPYWLIMPEMNFASAFFESASGFTTTGASVIDRPERLPRSLLFWRALSQWIGGFGVVIFFGAILGFLGVGAKVLYSFESSGQSADMDSSRIQKGLLSLFLLYTGLTVIGIGALYYFGMSLFDAVCHMFATLSTGGYSNYSDSAAHYKSPSIEYVTIIFMILGGMSFILMLNVVRGKWGAMLENSEFKSYIFNILGFSILTAVILYNMGSRFHGVSELFRTSMFQVVSLMTSTGFSTYDYDQWQSVIQIFLIMLMATGGCSASTAGGLKTVRVFVATKVCMRHVEQAYRPRVVRAVTVNKVPLENSSLEAVMTFMVMSGLIFFFGVFVLALLEYDLSFEGSFAAVVACLFNVGPGFAEVGPTHTYAFMSEPAKIFLAIIMLVGRLEFYAILVLFAPSLWKGFS